MSLTSPWLVGVLGALALLIGTLAVADRPRPRAAVPRTLVRLVRLVLVNVLVLGLCAVLLNNRYQFYGSWGDVFGGGTTGAVHQIGGSAAALPVSVAGAGLGAAAVPTSLPALPNPRQRVQEFTLTPSSLGSTASVLVVLPRGYDPAKTRTYPVIVGLHGFPGSPHSLDSTGILGVVNRLTLQRKIAPSIIVLPQIDVPDHLDTECVNGGPGQPQVDTWLSAELPQWVTQHFRVRTDRLSWATLGYSYGGWCAASLGLRHPDVFGAAVVFQGYFRPQFSAGFAPSGPGLHGFDLVALAATERPPVALWVLASKEDGTSWPTTKEFLGAARTPTAVTAFVLPSGGHRIDVWQPHISKAVSWLGRTLPGFQPVPPGASKA